MAETKAPAARPLSPHLQIYRPMLTMMMSIVHRITGFGLYFGTLLLAWWFIAAAGPNGYARFEWFIGSWIGRLILLGYTWALIHHMLGGVRHLIWDTGRGLGPVEREWLVAANLIGSIVITLDPVGHRAPCHGRLGMSGAPHIRTPLARVRGFGTAKSGTAHFWHQRVTAIANIPLTIAAVIILITLLGRNQAAVAQILGSPAIAIIMLLFIASITIHMRIGMAVIIEDYVHDESAKLALLMANTFFTIVVGLAAVYGILKLSFGL